MNIHRVSGGPRAPGPHRQKDGRQQALHTAGGQIHQKLRNSPVEDRFEVFAEGPDVPVVDKGDSVSKWGQACRTNSCRPIVGRRRWRSAGALAAARRLRARPSR